MGSNPCFLFGIGLEKCRAGLELTDNNTTNTGPENFRTWLPVTGGGRSAAGYLCSVRGPGGVLGWGWLFVAHCSNKHRLRGGALGVKNTNCDNTSRYAPDRGNPGSQERKEPGTEQVCVLRVYTRSHQPRVFFLSRNEQVHQRGAAFPLRRRAREAPIFIKP